MSDTKPSVYRHMSTWKLKRLFNREMKRAEHYRTHHYMALIGIHLSVAEEVSQELDQRGK